MSAMYGNSGKCEKFKYKKESCTGGTLKLLRSTQAFSAEIEPSLKGRKNWERGDMGQKWEGELFTSSIAGWSSFLKKHEL